MGGELVKLLLLKFGLLLLLPKFVIMWGGGEASELGDADEFKSVVVACIIDGVGGLGVTERLRTVGITMLPPPFGPTTAIDGRTTARL